MKELHKNLQEAFKNPHTKKTLKILGVILAAMIIFSGGMIVGFFKGEFSEKWDRNYMGVMGGPRSPFSTFSDTDGRAPSPHGTAGQVISFNNNQLVIKGPGDTENVVTISPQTVIRELHRQGTTTEILAGSWVTAIGSPDESGRLVATFVRIMPAPPQNINNATNTIK